MLRKIKDFYYVHIAKRIKDKEVLFRLIIDAQLKKYGVDYDYIMKNQQIEGEPWYTYYTFDSKQESEKWEKFAKKLFRKATPSADESYINKRFSMFNLMWGLKTTYNIYED